MNEKNILVNLILSYNGISFNVEVDIDTYNNLAGDPETANIYAEQIYKNMYEKENNNCASTSKANESSSSSKNEFKWADSLIRLLLQTRLSKEWEFSKPSCKKIKLWRKVAEEMNTLTVEKFNITSEMCDSKYRNLLSTYRSNKKKSSSTGESSIKWEYFEIFDEVLGNKASSFPSKEMIGDSLREETDDISSMSEIENKDDIVKKTGALNKDCKKRNLMECSLVPENENSGPSAKGKRIPISGSGSISLQNYLYEKLRRKEMYEEENRKKKEIRLEMEKEKWEEKKKLKEKEIDAILMLAKAISEKK